MAQTSVPDVHVQLLGPLRLHVNGIQIDTHTWKSKKALTLFKFLVARCGDRSPKDVLIELLWPENEDVERSTHNLHTVVYYLRRELEPQLSRYEQPRLLRHSGGLYWFERGPGVRVDLDEFLKLTREAEQLYGSNAAASLQLYRRALHLYEDDFSPEDLYEDWATTLREQLRERYITAVMGAAELIDRLGDDRLYAISICRTALQHEPFREELHRMLIMHLVKAGFHGEAASQYRACERMLEDEFGLKPSSETVALYEQLKRVRSRYEYDHRERTMETAPGTASLSVAEVNLGTPRDDDGGTAGPMVCDRETYAFLHKLELRRQARTGRPVTLLRIALGKGLDVDATERATSVRVLQQLLRSGDVFCWETPAQLLVQLASTSADGARAVQNRLQYGLEQAGLLFFEIRFSVLDGEHETRANADSAADGSKTEKTHDFTAGVAASEHIGTDDSNTHRAADAPFHLPQEATG